MNSKSQSTISAVNHALLWLRADLRVTDNTALNYAIASGLPVIAVYIVTPMQWYQHHISGRQIDLIERRLHVVKQQLNDINIPLLVVECHDFSTVPATIATLCQQHQISAVYCNRQHPWNEKQRDFAVEQALIAQDRQWHCVDDYCVLPPGSVLTQQQKMYKVFTPYRNAWLKQFLSYNYQPVTNSDKVTFSQHCLNLLEGKSKVNGDIQTFNYSKQDSLLWPVDESAIQQRLQMFCETKAEYYQQQRDFPAIDGTSCLSPYLAIGALSARQCLAALMEALPQCVEINKQNGAFVWLSEVIWREFYNHLLDSYGRLSKHQPFQLYTHHVRWLENSDHLHAWQQGKTGFPIVDAAMRQLATTGWMHNRLRMISASFLVKDMLCDWRIGEQWFMQQLIDGELASNNGGWQWAASTGTDAQPYFRVFNPTTQSERFDPNGVFIRQWIPELQHVPDKYIHSPSLWSGFGGVDYPLPIVDHKQMRLLVIDSYKQAKTCYDSQREA
ncbi:deoxyribodipyrimidine photo-lyase [Photobacterium kishitanii]|uniref:deoxyribodipyrimidine photo-lyase n=1 Tax=Photobacterium kishitanii TaxID=318456 RepID=UPI0005D3D3A0|nr:deoxyribodipyrimidine photo-lyase [Photobacterium kishitanii]OBU30888.1 deoxyribodipyrimidine photo-lyase [Photobacterium kishitanii]PSV08132.1 deoxyribodipyrimidine photo-lyase [Photobacterium kishitanii]PSV75518.1 deoxyribodipyrimidine photo-lyase [Photobacterium kishitanii]PSW47663.1 deoxyribodipyrimidine photo-lyase [Photobacterium kishitanii]